MNPKTQRPRPKDARHRAEPRPPAATTTRLKAVIDHLAVLHREQRALDARRRKIEGEARALAASLFGNAAEGATAPAKAPSVERGGYADTALRLALAHAGEHYSAYVAEVYGEDTARARERLRGVLSHLRRQGHLASLGSGAWGPPSGTRPVASPPQPGREGTMAMQALALLRTHPDGLTASQIRNAVPGDKLKGAALYNAAYQLHAKGLVDRVEHGGRRIYRAKSTATAEGGAPV